MESKMKWKLGLYRGLLACPRIHGSFLVVSDNKE